MLDQQAEDRAGRDAAVDALMMKPTKNQEIAKGLREMADYLDANPELPTLAHAWAAHSEYGDQGRDAVVAAHKILGEGCQATANDYNVTVAKTFRGGVQLQFSVNRDAVCKRITTWECKDKELMASLGLKKEGVD